MSLNYENQPLDIAPPTRLAKVETANLLGPIALSHLSVCHAAAIDFDTRGISFRSADMVLHEVCGNHQEVHATINDIAQGRKDNPYRGQEYSYKSALYDAIADTRVRQEIWDIDDEELVEKGLGDLEIRFNESYLLAEALMGSRRVDDALTKRLDFMRLRDESTAIRDEVGIRNTVRLANQRFEEGHPTGIPLKIVQWAGPGHMMQPVALAAKEGVDVSIKATIDSLQYSDSYYKYLRDESLTERDIVREWAVEAMVGAMWKRSHGPSFTQAIRTAMSTVDAMSDKETWDALTHLHGWNDDGSVA